MVKFDTKFNSDMQEWETPQHLFDRLNNEFYFTLDLAANPQNAKCINYYSKNNNAFIHTWNGFCWLNPPYGDKAHPLQKWVKKAYKDSKKDACIVVMLLPVRSNTNWWHEYCMQAKEIRFIRGRPKFGETTHGLPQPLAIIIFAKHDGETKYTSLNLNGYDSSQSLLEPLR